MLKYKYDNRLFYIGKSVNLSRRLADHYNRSSLINNRLGLFLKTVGWLNVSVHILEFCSEIELDQRENYYIENYLPSLNRKFSTPLTANWLRSLGVGVWGIYSSKLYRSLNGLLLERQFKNRLSYLQLNKNFNFNSLLWVYSFPEFKLISGSNFESFSKFKQFSKQNIENRTIYKYVDTFTPYNGLLFLSADLLSLDILNKIESIDNYFKSFNLSNTKNNIEIKNLVGF